MRRRQRFCVFTVIDCLSVKEGAAVQVVERFASSRGIVHGRLLRLDGGVRRLTVFVRHENVVRLLEFLGYRQEE